MRVFKLPAWEPITDRPVSMVPLPPDDTAHIFEETRHPGRATHFRVNEASLRSRELPPTNTLNAPGSASHRPRAV